MFVIKNENKFIFSVYYSFSVIFLNIHYTSPSFAATSIYPHTSSSCLHPISYSYAALTYMHNIIYGLKN